jgi:hypothetical protein
MENITICWHVNDLKVSHEDPAEVTAFGEWLSEPYRMTMVTHRGKFHNYLGMILDYSCKGKVMVNITEYIKPVILDFLEEITTIQATRAAVHLFEVWDTINSWPLQDEQARAFHHTLAQLLFLSTWARCDIQPAAAFLTTRVKSPDKDSWGKVKRLLGYLKGTLHMPLILLAD